MTAMTALQAAEKYIHTEMSQLPGSHLFTKPWREDQLVVHATTVDRGSPCVSYSAYQAGQLYPSMEVAKYVGERRDLFIIVAPKVLVQYLCLTGVYEDDEELGGLGTSDTRDLPDHLVGNFKQQEEYIEALAFCFDLVKGPSTLAHIKVEGSWADADKAYNLLAKFEEYAKEINVSNSELLEVAECLQKDSKKTAERALEMAAKTLQK